MVPRDGSTEVFLGAEGAGERCFHFVIALVAGGERARKKGFLVLFLDASELQGRRLLEV